MDYRPFLPRQASGCVVCPSPLPCSCQANEECIRINRDCSKCDENKCVPIAGNTTPTEGGVSKGALAGGIVGAMLFFAIALALFFGYRRKVRARKARVRRSVKDTPAPAEMVLNRPDPTEKPPSELNDQVPVTQLNNPQPHSSLNLLMNPFDDANSIQTAGTEGTNVIPIALVSLESEVLSSSPIRPVRSPDLSLNLEHLNVSHDNFRNGAGSTRSGISGISRNSYMSSASYASEFLNEAPMIMTPTQGAVRQVLGVVKAEVINTATSDTLKPHSYTKPVVRSPLASKSFVPNQTLHDDEETHDPFADENMSTQASYGISPAPTTTTFRASQAHRESARSTLAPDIPHISWSNRSRPASLSTQAGSVIDIASATRVNLGLKSPGSFGTTVGRLVSPTIGVGALQDQQRRALEAQVQAHGLDIRRVSGSSVLSATSTRADSILESFPFVPPSPISDRPIRSPPVSPLSKQSFTSGTSTPTNTLAAPSSMTHQSFSLDASSMAMSDSVVDDDPLPAPPNRRMLGLSTGSNISTASSGLGSFPFQIESENSVIETPPLTAYPGIKRASLDTLALTNDLSSYPLSFERSGFPTPK